MVMERQLHQKRSQGSWVPGDLTIEKLLGMSKNELRRLNENQLRQAAGLFRTETNRDRRENAIKYYISNSSAALSFHTSTAQTVCAGGGNRSGKTEGMLVELVSCCTGIFPASLKPHIDIAEKFRGPVSTRVVVESLTTTLYPTILPKLMWNQWTGIDEQWGERGHWGWIPRWSLIHGSWKASWDTKLRILRMHCRDPDTMEILGQSTIQFMSKDQDPQDFASGEFHIVCHDEPPTEAIWRENEMRCMSVGGRMLLAMTWYDDPAIAVDYLYDNIYEPGMDPDNKDITWVNYWTVDNPNLDQDAVARTEAKYSKEISDVRMRGQPIRFSGRIHPGFQHHGQTWCFDCHESCTNLSGSCSHCGGENLEEYCHVQDFDIQPGWPVVYVLDMHPRKPHMMSWWYVTPADDLWCVATWQEIGDPVSCRESMDVIENDLELDVKRWLCDPKMGAQSASSSRDTTWIQAFNDALVPVEPANSSGHGIELINELMKPDAHTRQPRMLFHPRCEDAIQHFSRFAWQNFKRALEKEQNQKPGEKYSDYPAMARYLVNDDPTFEWLMIEDHVIRKIGTQRVSNYKSRQSKEPIAQWQRGQR
jgi:hypothetical protein